MVRRKQRRLPRPGLPSMASLFCAACARAPDPCPCAALTVMLSSRPASGPRSVRASSTGARSRNDTCSQRGVEYNMHTMRKGLQRALARCRRPVCNRSEPPPARACTRICHNLFTRWPRAVRVALCGPSVPVQSACKDHIFARSQLGARQLRRRRHCVAVLRECAVSLSLGPLGPHAHTYTHTLPLLYTTTFQAKLLSGQRHPLAV